MKKKPSEYNGIVLLAKPMGQTSHDVVDKVRRIFGTRRVGHTGTLDPDATGLLVLCLGYGTRIAEFLSAGRKTYKTEVRFGIETDTEDTSGKITREVDASQISRSGLEEILSLFRGDILQVPPMVSALHHEGRRLHELAREGVIVEREARSIVIYSLELERFEPGRSPLAAFTVTCSSGTYIRTLASDLGKSLGVGGAMQTLKRTQVSNGKDEFNLEDALTLETLSSLSDNNELGRAVLPLSEALKGWVQLTVSEEEASALRQGRRIPISPFHAESKEPFPVAVRDEKGVVFAIARAEAQELQPTKVLIS